MRKYGIGLALIGLIVGWTQCAAAQLTPGMASITVFGGKTFNRLDDMAAGAAVELNLGPNLAFEGEAGVIFADDKTFNLNLDLMLSRGSAVTQFVPYVIGGAGIFKNGGTDIALNVGVGLKVFVERNIALRADFRGFFVSDGGKIDDLERLYIGLTLAL